MFCDDMDPWFLRLVGMSAKFCLALFMAIRQRPRLVADRPVPLACEERGPITGVGLPCAHVIIAELGANVTAQFPTPTHAAAWAKLTPIARQSGTTTRLGRPAKATDGSAAHSAPPPWPAHRAKTPSSANATDAFADHAAKQSHCRRRP
jgi:hypothetical protein